MKRKDLPELQRQILKIMDIIHEICEKNNIKYYIIGGTALGAVRHHGFIPWDVDIDIAMHRQHYDRFKECCVDQLPLGFEFIDYNKDLFCHTNHGFVVNKSSVNLAVGGGSKYGIFVDVFPLDNVPDNIKNQQNQEKSIKRWNKIRYFVFRAFGETDEHNKIFKNISKFFIRLLSKFLSLYDINKHVDGIMRKYNELDAKNWCSMCSHYSYNKQNMDKLIYGEPQLIDFEGRQYYAPSKVKEYLTILYGNYMKLPSKEEQDSYFED